MTSRAATAARPGTSLFSHNWTWTDEKGESVTFARWAGKPLVVTAIFTRCRATCPRTMAKLLKVYDGFRAQGLEAQVPGGHAGPGERHPRGAAAVQDGVRAAAKPGICWPATSATRAICATSSEFT